MKKTILGYAAAVAGSAFLLQWLEYQYAIRVFSTEIYVVIIAVLFTVFGAWVGLRIAPGGKREAFVPNTQAMDYLGISKREYEVLGLLAKGLSNQEIAKALFVSTNTVKSHLSRIYAKLDVSRRTQAIEKARSLSMLP